MADIKISKLTNYTPITDGVVIPCSVKEDGSNYVTRMIVTQDFAKYIAPQLKDLIECGRGISITVPTDKTKGFQIACNLDTTLFKVVSSLPTTEIDKDKIYLVPNPGEDDNVYIEYIYTGTEDTYDSSKWEKVGERQAATDLSGYLTSSAYDDKEKAIKALIETAQKAAEAADAKAVANASDISTLNTTVAGHTSKITSLEENSATKTEIADMATKEWANGEFLKTHQSLDDYAKKSEVTSQIADAIDGIGISDYLKKTEASSTYQAKGNYATKEDITDFLTEEEITQKIAAAVTDGKVDLTGYATQKWVEDKKYLIESDVTSKGYQTSSDVTSAINSALADYVESDEIEDMATKTWVNEQNYLTQHQSLTDYAKTEYVDSKVSTECGKVEAKIPSLEGYAKENWVEAKGYITDSALSGLASESYVDDAIKKVDVTSQLADYMKTADADKKYETIANVSTKESALKDADTALANRLTEVEKLTAKVAALEAKLAEYDKRFGYSEDGNWKVSFLVIDDERTAE